MSNMKKQTMSSRPSVLFGVVVTILLLLHPTSTAAKKIATGTNDLLAEIEQLHGTLARVTDLLATADVPENEAVMLKAAGLVERVRSLVFATEKYHMSERERRAADRQANNRRLRQQERERIRFDKRGARKLLRGNGIGNGEVEADLVEQNVDVDQEHRQLEKIEMDYLARNLFDTTITFPECNEKFLEDCLTIIYSQMEELEIDAEMIIHKKRDQHIEGYNKVVLVTDMNASIVKGRNNDGIVSYPFPWEDSVTNVSRMLGVEGKFDCHQLSPEDCCVMIKNSAPNPDMKGNYLECHVFIPFGGKGNAKRSDRVFINLSPDGRVHEPPHIS